MRGSTAGHRQGDAFTLVELLVVVTVTVVLLALLTPALDRAIYQAELATCGANLKSMGAGVISYASENRRLYPYRPSVGTGSPSFAIVWGTPSRDDRPILRTHLLVNKSLNDPLAKSADLEHRVLTQNYVYSNYNLWWSWQWFSGANKGQAMRKVGDRFSQAGDDRAFRLLASDWDRVSVGAYSQSGHPDRKAVAVNLISQGQSVEDDPTGTAGDLAAGSGNIYTVSQWVATDASARGSMDRSFLYDDGAVIRLSDLRNGPNDEPDERLVTVSSRSNMDFQFLEYLPRP